MSNNTEQLFPLQDSLCLNCANRLSRVFVPLDYGMYGLDLDDFDLEEGEPLEIEQHTCLVLGQDLDGVVSVCNKYLDTRSKNLLNNYVF